MYSSLLEDEKFSLFLTRPIEDVLPDLSGLAPEVALDSLKCRLQDDIQQESMRRSKEGKDELHTLQRQRQHLLQRISWYQGSTIGKRQ